MFESTGTRKTSTSHLVGEFSYLRTTLKKTTLVFSNLWKKDSSIFTFTGLWKNLLHQHGLLKGLISFLLSIYLHGDISYLIYVPVFYFDYREDSSAIKTMIEISEWHDRICLIYHQVSPRSAFRALKSHYPGASTNLLIPTTSSLTTIILWRTLTDLMLGISNTSANEINSCWILTSSNPVDGLTDHVFWKLRYADQLKPGIKMYV